MREAVGAANSRYGVAPSRRSSNFADRGPPSSAASANPIVSFFRIAIARPPRGLRPPLRRDTIVQTGWMRDCSGDAIKKRRCVVPVSGFYEWQARDKGPKQPYYTTRADGEIMCLAGLWDRWDKGGEPLETYTIITTDANELLGPIHPRMPVVLERENVDAWLAEDDEGGLPDLRPAAAGVLETAPVSTRVGSVANNDASLIEPLGGGSELF